jgi:hypothetical protein
MDNIVYSIKADSNCAPKVTKETSNKRVIFDYPCVSNTECKPYEIFLLPGRYKFELWGSEGGYGRYQNIIRLNPETSGKGAFVSGIIDIRQSQLFYAYIGGRGTDQTEYSSSKSAPGGYNGGGKGGVDLADGNYPESGAGGGGSTDIRLISDSYNAIESQKSRIIVAGAGGGGCSLDYSDCVYTNNPSGNLACSNSGFLTQSKYGGPAGALHGYATTSIVYPGNQTNGSFWKGMDGISISSFTYRNEVYYGGSTAGGGSGYFGGTTISLNDIIWDRYYQCGGAGGSSYVSGCLGCRSVSLMPTNVVKTTSEHIHYSKLVFKNIVMKSGVETFVNQRGESETGHRGHGSLAITFLGPPQLFTCHRKRTYSHSFIYVLIVLSS